MGDDQDRRAALPGAHHRRHQRRLALGIEERIGLVEHQHRRIAVKRPRQCDPLRLARRKPRTHRPKHRVITLRQLQDEIVHPGEPRRRDRPPVDILALVRPADEARYIVLDAAFEQARFLRQITEMMPQLILVPVAPLRPVDPDIAEVGNDRPGDDLGQRRLARSARPDHPDDLARRRGKADPGQDRHPVGPAHADILDPQMTFRLGQGGADTVGVIGLSQHVGQPLQRHFRRPQLRPAANQCLDRLQCPPEQDRRGDDRPRRNVPRDRQQGTQPKRSRLNEHPQEPARRRIAAAIELRFDQFA